LLREAEQIGAEKQTEFLYVDIDELKGSLIKQYFPKTKNEQRSLIDFCFFSFFGGNDFVDAFIHTKMRNRGFDKLFHAYQNLSDYMIEEDLSINVDQLQTFINCLAKTEKHDVRKDSKVYTEEKTYESDKLMYEHSIYTNNSNPFSDYYSSTFEVPLSQNHLGWYNRHFFNNIEIKNVCDEFVRSLKWTWLYYTSDTIPSWSYFYKYRNSPLPSDLINSESLKFINKHTFEKSSPLTPLEQLLVVTPPQNANLLPSHYQEIIQMEPLDQLYPKKVKLDVVKGLKNIYSDPILPPVNLPLIQKVVLNVEITEYEANRNVIHTEPFSKTFSYT
jgi:5'-3' exoribonuclease 1